MQWLWHRVFGHTFPEWSDQVWTLKPGEYVCHFCSCGAMQKWERGEDIAIESAPIFSRDALVIIK